MDRWRNRVGSWSKTCRFAFEWSWLRRCKGHHTACERASGRSAQRGRFGWRAMWFVSLSKYAISLSVTRSTGSFSSWKRVGQRSEATDSRTFPDAEARRSLSESQSTFSSFISKPDAVYKSWIVGRCRSCRLHLFPQVNNWYNFAATQVYDSHNMQIASSYCFEFRRSWILWFSFWTLPSIWRTVYSPRLGNQGFYRWLHGCHDGTFDRVQTWIRKGQAFWYSLSLGTGQDSVGKGEVAQETHWWYACRSFH